MRRREFIAGLGGAAAWPVVARAQQPALPVIGYLSTLTQEADRRTLAAYRRGLDEQGYVEGRNVEICDLLQIEWVKWGGFSQVECDSKGFFVNVTVTSSRHVCAHAKIDQDEAPER